MGWFNLDDPRTKPCFTLKSSVQDISGTCSKLPDRHKLWFANAEGQAGSLFDKDRDCCIGVRHQLGTIAGRDAYG